MLFSVVVRQFVSSDSETCWRCKSREKTSDTAAPVKMDSISDVVLDMKTRLVSVMSELMRDVVQPGNVWTNVRPHLTLTNVSQLGKLMMVLVLAMVTGIIAGVKQLAQFCLKLLHELANLVDRSTPLALGALNMFSKVIGGAYLLIAMIWRDATKKQPPPPPPSSSAPPRPAINMSRPGPGPELVQRRPVTNVRPDPRSAMDNLYSQSRNW